MYKMWRFQRGITVVLTRDLRGQLKTIPILIQFNHSDINVWTGMLEKVQLVVQVIARAISQTFTF